MNSSGKFSYVMRKYPLLRVLCAIFIISVILSSILIFNKKNRALPVIDSIVPPVGVPGDVVVINGENFGYVRDMSYVSFAGDKLTASSYISWSDKKIKVVLPANVQDGLVVVGVNGEVSNPALFANEVDIPVPVQSVVQTTKPVITGIDVSKARVGDLISIQGSNFGESRSRSKVLFSIDYSSKSEEADHKKTSFMIENMIPVMDEERSYEFWSNTEIKVRVPDGVCSGSIIVDNGEEQSEPYLFTVDTSIGKKIYTNKKIYLIQYTADVADVVTNDISTITFRCPMPVTMASQPELQITEIVPEPILYNYQNNLIHQITKSRNNAPKSVFKQTFVMPVYEIKSTVNEDRVTALKKADAQQFEKYLRADELIPSDNEKIVALAKDIVKKEKNPYRQARLIYKYICKNITVSENLRRAEADPVDLIEYEMGDAYDFAIVYTAMLRSLGIPCMTDGGILINQDLSTLPHWWCEFYISGAGWIPVDVVMGAGYSFGRWQDDSEDNMFYFGNLDCHHVAFSRGWNKLKPFSKDYKIVQYPRSFALQSIWEEVSAETSKYSSFWSVPVVKGVY